MMKSVLSSLVLASLFATTSGASATNRLTIVNGCSNTLWIAHNVQGVVGPDPQDLRIDPQRSVDFTTNEQSGSGLVATRFWPKRGCDGTGNNCTIGDSGGPAEGCVIRIPGQDDDYSHCAPPVDSKFEATFSRIGSGFDTVDLSLVDGFSVPFKLEVSGGDCSRVQKPFTGMDCSQLSQSQCPKAETINGKSVDLRAIDPKTGKVAGCFSPCMRLTDDKFNDNPVAPDSVEAAPYCCAGSYGTPDVCSVGPILQTQYLKAVRAACPAAYGYAYDDKTATIVCTTTTQYRLTFYC